MINSRGNRTWIGRRGNYANANFNTAAEEVTNTPQQRHVSTDEDEYAYDGGQTLSRQTSSSNQDNDFDDPLINPVSYVKENVHLEESNKSVRKNEDEFKIDSILDETNADEEVPASQSDNQPVILTSNFYLPDQSNKNEDGNSVVASVNNEEDYDDETKSTEEEQPARIINTEEVVTLNPEYEYYDDYEDEATTISAAIKNIVSSSTETVFVHSEPNVVVELNSEPKSNLPDIKLDNDTVLGEAVVSVVTTKSVVNGSTSNPDMSTHTESSPENVGENVESDSTNSSTESWVVVASVQTSRSVSGARFLPFPQVEQEERKQSLAELEATSFEEQETKNLENGNDDLSPTTLHPSVAGKDGEERAAAAKEEEVTESAVEVTTFEEEFGTLSSTQPIDTHTKTTTNEHLANISTESIIDKLDRVQSELSSDLLSGKFPVINGMAEHVEAHPTSTTGTPVIIRKFTPRTTTTIKPTDKKITFDTLPMDDLSGLLPFGFKPRNTGNYRNKKVIATKTTAAPDDENAPKLEIRSRNANISRSFKSKPAVQDIIVPDDVLPKDFKLKTNTLGGVSKLSDLLSNIKFEDNIEQLLPKNYTHFTADETITTNKPTMTTSPSGITDDVNKLLPSGYKLFTTTKPLATVRPSLVTIAEDVSKFLPPGYKSYQRNNAKKPAVDVIPLSDNVSKQFANGYKPKDATTTSKPPLLGVIPIANNDILKFLPPGFKLPAASEKPVPEVKIADDISKFLPPGYKPTKDDKTESASVADDILRKLLPPGYKRPESEAAAPKVVVNENLSKLLPPGFKLEETKPHQTDTSLVDSILNKIKFKEPSSLVPVGFVADSNATTPVPIEEPTTARNLSGLKVVFPKGFKRPGVRVTTAKPSHLEGPSKPEITIRKGLPVR